MPRERESLMRFVHCMVSNNYYVAHTSCNAQTNDEKKMHLLYCFRGG